jgi:hypothetical protein
VRNHAPQILDVCVLAGVRPLKQREAVIPARINA